MWNEITADNCSRTNEKLYDKYKLGDTGTVIINTLSPSILSNLTDELKYKCNLHYYYLSNELEIIYNDEINKKNWILNSKKHLIDFTESINDSTNKYEFNIYPSKNIFYAEYIKSKSIIDKK